MIHGTRTTLRPLRRDDLPALRRWHDDGEVMQYWGERQPIVTEGAFEADLAPGGQFTKFEPDGYFCICDETGRAIGRLDYEGFKMPERSAELGILIGEKDAWSKGYGSDAIIAFLEWFFNEMGAHRSWLTVLATNTRAMRAYEKIGYVREGTWREQTLMGGQRIDEHLYGILCHEFNAKYHPTASV